MVEDGSLRQEDMCFIARTWWYCAHCSNILPAFILYFSKGIAAMRAFPPGIAAPGLMELRAMKQMIKGSGLNEVAKPPSGKYRSKQDD